MTSLSVIEYSEWHGGEDAKYWRCLTVQDLRDYDVRRCDCGRTPKALVRRSSRDGKTYVDVKCPKCGAFTSVCTPDMDPGEIVALAFDQWNDPQWRIRP